MECNIRRSPIAESGTRIVLEMPVFTEDELEDFAGQGTAGRGLAWLGKARHG